MTDQTTDTPSAVYDVSDQSWPPSGSFLSAFCTWLATHGIDPNATTRVELIAPAEAEVGGPLIRVYQIDRTTGVAREPFNFLTKTPPPSPEDYA
ncbi:hypothetical protein [Actinoallomurus sp. CA-142502]|uniref:hypothetical protein n=1 Tax=Actinoallomurus sp. CA-142502 TaxID=3239885 RepID=UPI003D900000